MHHPEFRESSAIDPDTRKTISGTYPTLKELMENEPAVLVAVEIDRCGCTTKTYEFSNKGGPLE